MTPTQKKTSHIQVPESISKVMETFASSFVSGRGGGGNFKLQVQTSLVIILSLILEFQLSVRMVLFGDKIPQIGSIDHLFQSS